jgi:hypothetical protein
MPLLPLLQDTPNTVNYMLAGYAVLLGVPALYVVSWFIRRRNLRRDLETIERLAADEQKRAGRRRAGAPAADAPARERTPDAR